jgi:hypothetical protein
MLAALNVLFFVFHTALIVLNVFGWIPRATRRWNLAALLLTFFSWVVMGLWFGAGYCLCTDLHFRVREAMGVHDEASSYLALLVNALSGWNPPTALVNGAAFWVFAFSMTMSVALNVRDWRHSRRAAVGVSA